MSTPESAPKQESAAEILKRKRMEKIEAAKKEEELIQQQKEERQREENEAKDTELKSQIAKLQAEREDLVNSLETLKAEYEEGGEAVRDFSAKKKAVDEVIETYADDLAEEGITSRKEFIDSDAFSDTKEPKEYNESSGELRKKAKAIVKTKKGLRDKIGVRTKKRGETSRDNYYKKIEDKIKEIDAEIVALGDQTSERIAEKEKIEECRLQMKGGALPFSFNRNDFRITSNLSSCCLYDASNNNQVDNLVRQFGEKVFKEALMTELDEVVSELVEEQSKKLNWYPEQVEPAKEKTLRAMDLKIDADLADRKIRAFERAHYDIKNIEKEDREIKFNRGSVDQELDALGKTRENRSEKFLKRIIVVNREVEAARHGNPEKIKYSVNFYYDPERDSEEISVTKQRIAQLKTVIANLDKEIGDSNPPSILFWKKEKYFADMEDKKNNLKAQRKELELQEAHLKKTQREEAESSRSDIWELSRKIHSGVERLFTGMRTRMTVKEFLDVIEEYWEKAKTRTLEPEKAELLAPYKEMKEVFQKLETDFKHLTRGW